MDVSQAQEAKELRDENTRLRKLMADLSPDKEALQSVIRKNGQLVALKAAVEQTKRSIVHRQNSKRYPKNVFLRHFPSRTGQDPMQGWAAGCAYRPGSRRKHISRLNIWPARTAINASTHDSGPVWVANSLPYDSFIHYTSPV